MGPSVNFNSGALKYLVYCLFGTGVSADKILMVLESTLRSHLWLCLWRVLDNRPLTCGGEPFTLKNPWPLRQPGQLITVPLVLPTGDLRQGSEDGKVSD